MVASEKRKMRRQWDARTEFYVAEIPCGKSDWGYTTDIGKATLLSPYWQRRFAADCRRVNAKARYADGDWEIAG